jgi:hypothetical protein
MGSYGLGQSFFQKYNVQSNLEIKEDDDENENEKYEESKHSSKLFSLSNIAGNRNGLSS